MKLSERRQKLIEAYAKIKTWCPPTVKIQTSIVNKPSKNEVIHYFNFDTLNGESVSAYMTLHADLSTADSIHGTIRVKGLYKEWDHFFYRFEVRHKHVIRTKSFKAFKSLVDDIIARHNAVADTVDLDQWDVVHI